VETFLVEDIEDGEAKEIINIEVVEEVTFKFFFET
jgi:hypothetical protein